MYRVLWPIQSVLGSLSLCVCVVVYHSVYYSLPLSITARIDLNQSINRSFNLNLNFSLSSILYVQHHGTSPSIATAAIAVATATASVHIYIDGLLVVVAWGYALL